MQRATYSDVVDTTLHFEFDAKWKKLSGKTKRQVTWAGLVVLHVGQSDFHHGKFRPTQLNQGHNFLGLVIHLGRVPNRCRGRVTVLSSHANIDDVLIMVQIIVIIALKQIGLVFTSGERRHILKYHPQGNSGASRATIQL